MQPQFKIGDKAVYPAQGVTEIMGIESMDIGGLQQNFYVLRVLDTDKKIRIPINKVNAVGLRSVIQGEEVEEVYERYVAELRSNESSLSSARQLVRSLPNGFSRMKRSRTAGASASAAPLAPSQPHARSWPAIAFSVRTSEAGR